MLIPESKVVDADELLPVPEIIGEPLFIKIPEINLEAAIESVGLTETGSMDTPKLPMNTAWYNLGVRPGEIGSAVIDGHVNWKYGATAVFANLDNVKVGDKVTVEDNNGKLIDFIVREIRTYQHDDDASDIFSSSDGKSHLNIITCAGAWNKNLKIYSERLVIFTDRIANS